MRRRGLGKVVFSPLPQADLRPASISHCQHQWSAAATPEQHVVKSLCIDRLNQADTERPVSDY